MPRVSERRARLTARYAMKPRRALTHAQARAFYDRFDWLQDWQGFYESAALDVLVREGAFREAHAVVELGCGTGRLAERLLVRELPDSARYVGLDISTRRVERTRLRLARFGPRASVRQTAGSLLLPVTSGAFDRFVAGYVLEILSDDELELAIEQARRVLAPGGLLCVASLGQGVTRASRALCRAWSAIHRVHPFLVGGCRPVRIEALLGPSAWEILHSETIVVFAVPTEVVVARRRDG